MAAVDVEPERLEILDVLWRADPVSGERLPVRAADAAQRLRLSRQEGAARLVEALPRRGCDLDPEAVERVFLAVHFELARLSQFLRVPDRIASVLAPIVDDLRERGSGPVTVIDLGCGIGLDARHLAATRALGADVTVAGLDLNALLVGTARGLAEREDVPATFVVGDALSPDEAIADPARTIVVSSGVLHHLGRDHLETFFARHRTLGVAAFAHFDVEPHLWTRFGAWVLHRIRMREPVSRHDGNLSMRRALPATALLGAARAGTEGRYALWCDDKASFVPAPHAAMRPIMGVKA